MSKVEEELLQKKHRLLAVQRTVKPLAEQVLSTLKEECIDVETFCQSLIKAKKAETTEPMVATIEYAMKKPESVCIRYNGGLHTFLFLVFTVLMLCRN